SPDCRAGYDTERTCRAFPHVSAGSIQTPADTDRMRACDTGTSGPGNLLPAGDGAIENGHGLVGESARDLGRQLQATRRVTRRVEASTERGAKEMKPAEVSTPSDREVLVKRSFDA